MGLDANKGSIMLGFLTYGFECSKGNELRSGYMDSSCSKL